LYIFFQQLVDQRGAVKTRCVVRLNLLHLQNLYVCVQRLRITAFHMCQRIFTARC